MYLIKAITYTDEFKLKLVKETKIIKNFLEIFFRECGIDPDIVGNDRIHNSAKEMEKTI